MESTESTERQRSSDFVLGCRASACAQVYHVRDESTRREYALKKMRKTDLMGCSEHVFCEQHITRLIENPFVVKQYASFQDSKYL